MLKKKMKPLVAISLAIVFLSGCSQLDSGSTNTNTPQLSLENSQKVSEGMTYQEVVQTVGPPASELSSYQFGDLKTVMYQWEGGFMEIAHGTFQNDKLVAKAQSGLD